MTKLAYSTLTIKNMDDDKRTIRGVASTPTPDRGEDIVNPTGVKFSLPIPLLWQHRHDDPIGNVTEATVSEDGIEVTAEVAKGVSPEIDRYWSLIKSGLVRGLSIGFRGLEVEPIQGSWGLNFKEWEWLELSAVTIPMNAEASINVVKQYDVRPMSEKEIGEIPVKQDKPAASGKRVVKLNSTSRVREPYQLLHVKSRS